MAKIPTKARRKRKAKAKIAESDRALGRSNSSIDESALSKGELRKLNALRNSIGGRLGEEAFAKWLNQRSKQQTPTSADKNAALIADALSNLIEEHGLRIPRGGYLVTRGRGRVIVEQPLKSPALSE